MANWVAFVFHATAGFFVSPFVVGSLGNEVYGTWALLASLVGYLGLLDLGVRGAVTRFVSNLHAAGRHGESQRFASSALVVFTCTSVAAALVGIGFALVIHRFSIPPELLQQARLAVILAALTIGVTLITGVYGGIVTAMERFDLSSGTDVVVEALRILILVLALRAGYGLVALPAIQLGANLLRLGIAVYLSRRLYPEVAPSYRGWSRAHIVEIFDFSLVTTGLNGAVIIVGQLDALVIGWFLPIGRVTFFAIAGNLIRYAQSTAGAISTTMTPRVSALQGEGDHEAARRLPVAVARLATLVILPIVVTFVLRGKSFVGLWMGAEYGVPSGRVLAILSIPLALWAGRGVLASALMGMNLHKVLLLPYLGEAVANLSISIYLVQRVGIEGVAWGTAIPGVIVSGLVLPVIFARTLQVGALDLWWQVWIRPGLSVVPFAVATLLVERFIGASSLFGFFGQVFLLLPIAGAAAWLFSFDEPERAGGRRLWARLRRTR